MSILTTDSLMTDRLEYLTTFLDHNGMNWRNDSRRDRLLVHTFFFIFQMPKNMSLRITLGSQFRQPLHEIRENVVTPTGPTSTLAMRKKRAKLKEDPVAWALDKSSEVDRQRVRRKNRTEAQKQMDRENGRARSAKYNRKNKERHAKKETKKLVMTREGKKLQREYWKQKQSKASVE